VVATVLRLRFTTTKHQLQREWWRVLVLLGGAVWAASLLPSAWWASRVLLGQQASVRSDALAAISGVLILGWVVVPVLITGLDDALDPARFASLGVPVRKILPGMTVSIFLTVPSLFFLVVLALLALSWRPDGAKTLAVAFAWAALTLATMVLSARVSVAWTARVLQSRRSREAALAAILVGALVATPVAYAVVSEGLDTLLSVDVPALLEALRWTPIGLPVAAVSAAATGAWWSVAWRLGASLAWILLLHGVWRANVAYTLVHPTYRGGGARARDDAVLAAAKRAEGRRLGWRTRPQRAVASRAGSAQRAVASRAGSAQRAVASRARRYWITDPRYLSGLVSVMVFPALFFTLVYPIFGSPIAVVVAVPVLLAGTIGWGRHNDVAFDSTALWLDVVSGRLGREVMRGRVAATLAWAVPLVIVAGLAALGPTERWDLAPAEFGAIAGVLGTSLGVSAISAVALPYRAPAPGENPFSAEVGSVGAGFLAQVVSSISAWIVAVPVTLPLVAAIRWDARIGWLGLVLGLATGVGVLVVSTRWAGRLYDRKSGRLVAAVA
jgi:ABC-2 type transport system permease protein